MSTIVLGIASGKYAVNRDKAGRDRLITMIDQLMGPEAANVPTPDWSSDEVVALRAVADTLSSIRDATSVEAITGHRASAGATRVMGRHQPRRASSIFSHGSSSRVQGVST